MPNSISSECCGTCLPPHQDSHAAATELPAAANGLRVVLGGRDRHSHFVTMHTPTKNVKGKDRGEARAPLERSQRMQLAAEIGCEARELPDEALLQLAAFTRGLRRR